MGAIGGLLGLDGGAAGSGFSAPAQTSIVNPTNSGQLQTAYQGTQGALSSQQQLLQALQAQNGLGNQSQVYGQLQGVANGTGPNPAQAMLNQQTGQNVSNQAALMAGQRGAASNVGLMARQAAQQGAATQQQAVGQGATMQAQQSLNALAAAGNMANTQAGNQIGATTANTQAQQQEQQQLLAAQQGVNNSNVAMQSNINSGNAGLANTQMQGGQGLIGGLMNGAGVAMGGAKGGEVQKFDGGGQASTSSDPNYNGGNFPTPAPGSLAANPLSGTPPPVVQPTKPPVQSKFGQFLKNIKPQEGASSPQSQISNTGAGALQQGMSSFVQGIAGGKDDADEADAKGGNVGSQLKQGGHVPGKPAVKGPVNSYKNDNVKALLSPGEIVIPRSVSMSKDPVRGAAEFVAKVVAKRKVKK